MNGPVAVAGASSRNQTANQRRSLGAIVVEIKAELKSFVHTRVAMIRSELEEARAALKYGVPLILLAVVLSLIGFLLLSVAVAVLVAGAFAGKPYAWFLGFAIVGLLWIIFAAIAAVFAYNALRSRLPKRTLEVLKADKVWLQSEVRNRP